MKNLSTYINEKLKIRTSCNNTEYKYHPHNTNELSLLMDTLIDERGYDADFNDIDTSKIKDMSELFLNMRQFNGDISQWDVSSVTNMTSMFEGCEFFTGIGLENWNVKNVEFMNYIFCGCQSLECQLKTWEPDNLYSAVNAFDKTPLEQKPPKWWYNQKMNK